MDKGTAKVVSVDTNRMGFKVTCGDITDNLTVWFTGYMTGKQDIQGLEHLWGAQVNDMFEVDVEIIPPRTSTLTHLDVRAFTSRAPQHEPSDHDPVVVVYGLYPTPPDEVLQRLRAGITGEVVQEMSCPAEWVNVHFVAELSPSNNGKVFSYVTTATLAGKPDGEAIANTTATMVSRRIHQILNGKVTVETFICPVPNMQWRATVKAEH